MKTPDIRKVFRIRATESRSTVPVHHTKGTRFLSQPRVEELPESLPLVQISSDW